MTTRAVCTALSVFLGLLLTQRTSALEPTRPGQQDFVKRAVFADKWLWVLSDSGELSSIADGGTARVAQPLPEPALDLCRLGGQPLIVTVGRESDAQWTLRRWVEGRWRSSSTIPSDSDNFVALSCSSDGIVVLTSTRLIDATAGKVKSVALTGQLGHGLIATVFATADQLFVGFDAGEWGGGLYRIDRSTGAISAIEQVNSDNPCGGPLGAGCDPVNGIAAEPWSSQCVAIAIGMVHMSSHGRIVEVCGDKIRRLYYKELGQQPARARAGEEPFSTVAFFGLSRTGDHLWAVGNDGLYRITAQGVYPAVPLPKFRQIDGISVSFDVPDVVLVLTAINERRSLSGLVPLLVPR
jgi:hypothetical protein